MIHHISIDAQNPLRVASVLAEIWKGKVYQFLVPGSFLVIPFDSDGTHVVVLKRGDVWTPGADAESAKIHPASPADFVSAHAAISVPTAYSQIEQIGQREGWRVVTRHQGKGVPFSATELWVENRILFEFFPPEFISSYLQTMQPEVIDQMMGQPIQLTSGREMSLIS